MSNPITITSKTHGYIDTYVSDEDYDRVLPHALCVSINSMGTFYVMMTIKKPGGGYYNTALHRFIMDAPKGMFVDHINGNTLDNTRENLRLCTAKGNAQNQSIQKRKKTSKYKGVYRNSTNTKWVGLIKHSGIKYGLGSFSVEEDAARAYNKKALELFGEFAKLNIIEGDG
jgi:hypothetical protein